MCVRRTISRSSVGSFMIGHDGHGTSLFSTGRALRVTRRRTVRSVCTAQVLLLLEAKPIVSESRRKFESGLVYRGVGQEIKPSLRLHIIPVKYCSAS